ncbi:MAG TPA: transporter substrate-binding domain-containing protein, partial [Woeseiaceae bacterium]|nr:transporter substrate-binding domain-containing protein [Woeseiaceae bacterium]
MMNWKIAVTGAVLAVVVAGPAYAGATFDTVKQRGILQCGVNNGLPGFGAPNDKGEWSGLDVDFCRAVAAAVFGDATKVKFAPLTAKERFTALQSGEVD